ncbi:MAG TPA: CNNM domain-containing protein [Saprospiraceae bacterium]|nr:DUF21 domain-containing protein [Saprospiraceae bacterium]HPG08962.1 CNNM domain-containing protein [Saprospiraceae bacterium]HPQ99351.1 CNNM domain-containing protein [Saprospiraceae bacterium]HQU51984.1 CNNM domain-containing protein [Saprospiraceae bacterium]HRV86706.1 CNNM domain-containing protein [Saprospiraceae bacterium]
MVLLLIFFFVSLLFSFLCSIWEAVLLSITPSFISRKIQDEDEIAGTLLVYKDDIDRPLSAILTLNTIAHTVGAIGVGAQAGKLFGDSGWQIGGLHLNAESVIAALMTLAILIFSEIIPKTIGANYWQQLATFTIRSLRILLVALAPLVWLSQVITRKLKSDKDRSVLSRADFVALAHAGKESGVLAENESVMIRNLLELNNLTSRDVMTPRSVMQVANQDLTLDEYFRTHPKMRFSRIPLYQEEPDHITGFFLKDELLLKLLQQEGLQPLTQIRRPIVFLSDDLPLPQVFDRLMHLRTHIAIVIDEFGSVVGLLTVEDVIETILGLEIVDESDATADLQQLAREKWHERALKMGLIDEQSIQDSEK